MIRLLTIAGALALYPSVATAKAHLHQLTKLEIETDIVNKVFFSVIHVRAGWDDKYYSKIDMSGILEYWPGRDNYDQTGKREFVYEESGICVKKVTGDWYVQPRYCLEWYRDKSGHLFEKTVGRKGLVPIYFVK